MTVFTKLFHCAMGKIKQLDKGYYLCFTVPQNTPNTRTDMCVKNEVQANTMLLKESGDDLHQHCQPVLYLNPDSVNYLSKLERKKNSVYQN